VLALSALQETSPAQAVQQDITLILALLSAPYVMRATIPLTEEPGIAFFVRRTRTATPVQVRVKHAIKVMFPDKVLRLAVPARHRYSSHIRYMVKVTA
jgi:hypothetical protein